MSKHDLRGAPLAERSVSAADYASACASVDDGKPVYEGELGCCDVPCPNAAIRQDAFAQYEKDVGARAPVCVPEPGCVPPDACTAGRLARTNGVCELVFSPPP